MSADLESLAALPGVAGLCQHRGGEVVWARLPESVTAESAAALCAAVSAAFASYAGAGRVLREAWFEFPGMAVLVVCPPEAEEMLTFFVRERSAAADILATVRNG